MKPPFEISKKTSTCCPAMSITESTSWVGSLQEAQQVLLTDDVFADEHLPVVAELVQQLSTLRQRARRLTVKICSNWSTFATSDDSGQGNLLPWG